MSNFCGFRCFICRACIHVASWLFGSGSFILALRFRALLEVGCFDACFWRLWNRRLTVLIGLLARGLNAIGTAGGLNGWRWVFIVEGLLVSLSTSIVSARD